MAVCVFDSGHHTFGMVRLRGETPMWKRRIFFLTCLLSFLTCIAQAAPLPLTEIARTVRKESFLAPTSLDMQSFFSQAKQLEEVRAFLKELDPYAKYATPDDLLTLRQLTSARPAGIGMDIFRDRTEKVRCIPYPGSPAETAGIHYGDEVLSVNSLQVRGLPMAELAQRIRGNSGTAVRLLVQSKEEAARWLTIPRRVTGEYPSVLLSQKGSRPVIRIYRFGPQTEKELRACLKRLGKSEKALIDLRGNTGGSLEIAIACAKLFLPKGNVAARIQTKKGIRKEIAAKDGPFSTMQLKLMQDQYTASAGELFVAALVAAKRAYSFGKRTAGKACIQNLFTLSDGSILKLTTEKMLYPLRAGDWEGKGLDPHSSGN